MDNYLTPLKYENNQFKILDQTQLPNKENWIVLEREEDFWDAIKTLKVRGAPAIGVAAAYGLAVSLRAGKFDSLKDFAEAFRRIKEYLSTSRPTAVNLFWALDRMDSKMTNQLEAVAATDTSQRKKIESILQGLLEEAESIRTEDVRACKSMGRYGLSLLKPGMGILTHCNAGALATAGYGTCLSPIYLGQEKDMTLRCMQMRPDLCYREPDSPHGSSARRELMSLLFVTIWYRRL